MCRTKRALCLLLCLALLLLSGCQGEENAENAQAKLIPAKAAVEKSYRTVAAERQSFELTQGKNATFLPQAQTVYLDNDDMAFQEMRVIRDQWVEEGEVLAVFTSKADEVRARELELEISRLEASLDEVPSSRLRELDELNEQLQELPYYEREKIAILQDRIRLLELEGELERLETQHRIDQCRAELAQQVEAGRGYELTAPFSGYIDRVNNELTPGEPCARGTAVVTLYRTEDALLKVGDMQGQLRFGQEVDILYRQSGGDQHATGRVVRSATALPLSTYDGSALIRPDDPAVLEAVRSSTRTPTVTVKLVELTDALMLPLSAMHGIASGNDLAYVNVLDEQGLHKRFVSLVPLPGGADRVWILDGLRDGQAVALD